MTPLNRRLRPPCSLICCVDVRGPAGHDQLVVCSAVQRGWCRNHRRWMFAETDSESIDATAHRIRLHMTQHRHAGCAACLDSYWSKKTSGRNLWRPCHAQHRHPSAPVYCINPGIHCSWLSHHGNSRQGLQSNWLRNRMTTTALCSNPFIPLLDKAEYSALQSTLNSPIV